jgi:arylsulfatase A-like enzyme
MTHVNHRSALPLVAAAAALMAIFSGNATAAERPNVVLIISDDQDNEHLGFMGHPVAQTPTLDRLAEAGSVFTHAHLPMSRCHPTLASFLSGRWPHQTGIYYNYGTEKLAPEGSLPNLLRQAGYATFEDGKYWEGDVREMGFTHGSGRNNNFVRKGQQDLFDFVDEVGGKQPFFVWYAPRIPHAPHNPPDRFLEQFDRDRIPIPEWFQGDKEAFREKEHKSFAMEAWLDDGIRQFVAKLREKGLEQNTMVVFVIDNGWCNGLVSKGSPFEKGVRTPVFFSWPGKIPGGQRFDHLVSTLDVYPTILDYAGVAVPERAAGRSLRPIIEGKPAEVRDVLYGAVYPAFATEGDERPERDVYALYARTKKWKYILFVQDVVERRNRDYFRIQYILTDFPARNRGDQDLYDLESDPHELDNLASRPEHAERLRQFKSDVLAWWERTGGQPLDVP